jgi:AAA+ ATPase superfamily predicted ATPase
VSIILVKPEFVDRERELAWLEERFQSGGAELLVIYGRRRLGKTELLKRFLRSKRCIYFLASRTSLQDNVESLKKKIAEFTGKRLYERLQVRGLGELLTYLAEEVERPCLVIDEFGYLVELDRGVLSDLQAA